MPGSPGEGAVDVRRVRLFLALSCGLAWSGGLIVFLTGGIVDSPELVPGTGITLALVLIGTLYMGSPAVAHALTRAITREGWGDLYLRPQFRRAWRYWILAAILPPALSYAGAALYFAVFPQHFDADLTIFQTLLDTTEEQLGQPVPVEPGLLLILSAIQGILLAPILNVPFAFGEEFGWRAYLQPRLMALGARRGLLAVGLIWGIWHWPVIAMGHNFGLDYPGAPWLGILAMTWFTVLASLVFGWLTLRAGSVWPAVLSHGSLNGTAGLSLLVTKGQLNPILGPLPVGLVASAGWAVAAAWVAWQIARHGNAADLSPRQAPGASQAGIH